jgi:hypothetical protein
MSIEKNYDMNDIENYENVRTLHIPLVSKSEILLCDPRKDPRVRKKNVNNNINDLIQVDFQASKNEDVQQQTSMISLPPAIASILFSTKENVLKPHHKVLDDSPILNSRNSLSNQASKTVSNTEKKITDEQLYDEFFTGFKKEPETESNKIEEDLYADLGRDECIEVDSDLRLENDLLNVQPMINFDVLNELDDPSFYESSSKANDAQDLYGDLPQIVVEAVDTSADIESSVHSQTENIDKKQSNIQKSASESILEKIFSLLEKIHNSLKQREEFDLIVTKNISLSFDESACQSDPRVAKQVNSDSVYYLKAKTKVADFDLKVLSFKKISSIKENLSKQNEKDFFSSFLSNNQSSDLVDKLRETRLLEQVMYHVSLISENETKEFTSNKPNSDQSQLVYLESKNQSLPENISSTDMSKTTNNEIKGLNI